jgi:hypothetical protein
MAPTVARTQPFTFLSVTTLKTPVVVRSNWQYRPNFYVCEAIRKRTETFQKVSQSMIRRALACDVSV